VSWQDAARVIRTAPDAIVPAGTTLVSAANSNRLTIVIDNLSAVTTIRAGDGKTGATRGVRVGPGGRLTLATGAAVYVYSPEPVAISVFTMEA
jgi:hypothetical protein